jgi:hypothetical protein
MIHARTLTLAALAAATLAAGAARAQDYAEYNRQRAQHLFQTSRAPVKTYSGTQPGYYREYSTPTQDVREYQTPSYLRERVSPRGYERYTGPSERGYSVTTRPAAVYVPYVPYRSPYAAPYQGPYRSLYSAPPAYRPQVRRAPEQPPSADDYYPRVP